MAGRRNQIIDPYLAEKAGEHVRLMEERFAGEIRSSAAGSILYGGPDRIPVRREGKGCRQVFLAVDSVSAAIKSRDMGKIAILNFADYIKPGGLFLRGSHAQEESLCMESDLFGILQAPELAGYYAYNKANRNRDLYTDRAVYTPDVVFLRDDQVFRFDVITCAAPNKSAAGRYHRVVTQENHEAMQQRIRFLRDLAEDREVDVLIAGAWGCGVFGQPPTLVAQWFHDAFRDSGIKRILYAVPAPHGENANYRAFRKEFS